MGSLVDNALGIVNVPVITGTPRVLGLGGVRQVKEDETTETGAVARLGTNYVGKVAGRVGEDVVHTSQGKIVPITRKVGIGTEGDRALLVVDVQELLQVEDLNAVARFFAANNNVVLECTDLTPLAGSNASSLGKAA